MASDGSRPSLPMPLDLGHLPETFRHLGGGTSSEADRCPQTSGNSHRFLGIFAGHSRIGPTINILKFIGLDMQFGGYTAHHPKTFGEVQERPLR
jgi:hypothetical protein